MPWESSLSLRCRSLVTTKQPVSRAYRITCSSTEQSAGSGTWTVLHPCATLSPYRAAAASRPLPEEMPASSRVTVSRTSGSKAPTSWRSSSNRSMENCAGIMSALASRSTLTRPERPSRSGASVLPPAGSIAIRAPGSAHTGRFKDISTCSFFVLVTTPTVTAVPTESISGSLCFNGSMASSLVAPTTLSMRVT